MRRLNYYVAVLLSFGALSLASNQLVHCQDPSSQQESELISILDSNSAAADKALACKRLAVYGSSAAVPALGRMLNDEQLASWSRIALEAIPGKEADEALHIAANSLKGRLLVGAINSIGVRRDPSAVDLLTMRLGDADADVAMAAAAALGKIGNDAAAKTLRTALVDSPAAIRSAVAEGCILCAEHSLSAGNMAEAIAIYDDVRKAKINQQRTVEATRGAILARGADGIPLLLEQLHSPEKQMFQMALGTAREFPGRDVDQALAAELSRFEPERAALVILAMADRGETVEIAALLKAASLGPKQVRIAAMTALGRVGNVACVPALLELGLEPDAELADAAKTALSVLPDEKVGQEIIVHLPKAEGKRYVMLLELVGQRRIKAVNELVKALDHADQSVRSAALTSLGNTVPAEHLSVLISQVVAPKHAEDGPVAVQALKTASVRMPDRETCATQLTAAFEKSASSTKIALLEILGAVGGANALNTIGAAAKSSDPQLQDISTRLLGEWMTIDSAPVLLDLAKSAPGAKYQVRALRGYIRIARQFTMTEEQRVEMCQNAIAVSRQPAEQKLVLEILKRYPNPEMLSLAIEAAETPELKEDATQAALVIAQKLGVQTEEILALLSKLGLEKVKLEIIKAEYGAGTTQKDVTETLRKGTSDNQLIVLSNSSYNEAFGGDPASGTPKQLKIQYRINGKASEATFVENAVIVLPLPK